jgi:DNA-binding transcriptional LysR family regulator
VLPSVIREFRARYPQVRLNLHQGTSEQIAEMVASDRIDCAIATGSEQLFGDLTLLPCYRWHRSVIVPRNHPLADGGRLTFKALAAYPLITYTFSFTGPHRCTRRSHARAWSRTSPSPRAMRMSSRPTCGSGSGWGSWRTWRSLRTTRP